MTFWDFLSKCLGKIIILIVIVGFTGGFGIWKGYFSTAENYAMFQKTLIELGQFMGMYK